MDEVEEILSNINIDTPAGYRNRAILELLWASGMRVSELSGLNFGNLNLENNEITVFGKGSKERIILITDRAKNIYKVILILLELLLQKIIIWAQLQILRLFLLTKQDIDCKQE